MSREETLQTFIAITGASTASARQTAANILQATDYDLEQAANLFFASEAEANEPAQGGNPVPSPEAQGAAHGSARSSAQPDDPASLAARAALASYLQNAVPEESGQRGDYEVRAPDPSRRDMLYGETYRVQRSQGQQPDHLDAFRDFRTEQDMGQSSSAAEADKGNRGLAELFKAPADLLHKGTIDDAYLAAKSKGRWLLVNIQSNAQFATHQLNRDTWSNDMVRDIIRSSFVFWQSSDAAEAGQKVVNFYRLLELPAILIIDPLTGQKMKGWAGFVEPDRLLEELVPFMDRGIHDPQPLHKRRSMPSRAKPQATAEMSEEDQIAAAIAASAAAFAEGPAASAQPSSSPVQMESQQQLAPTAAHNESSAPATESSAAAKPASPTKPNEPRKTAAELEAALPPEPPAGSPDAVRVAIRMPTGRLQRYFTAKTPLRVVHDYCMLHEPDALAGKPFALAHALPGSPQLSDMKQTLQDANVSNSMLVMRWVA